MIEIISNQIRVGDILIIENNRCKQKVKIKVKELKDYHRIVYDVIKVYYNDIKNAGVEYNINEESILSETNLKNGIYTLHDDKIYICNISEEELMARVI